MVWWKDLWNWLKGPADADDARSTIEDPGAVTARPATWKDAFRTYERKMAIRHLRLILACRFTGTFAARLPWRPRFRDDARTDAPRYRLRAA